MKTYIMADIHGSFKPVRDFIQRHPFSARKEENTLILLGDAGLNFFFNERDVETKEKLSKLPIDNYFIIRGNHEERPSLCAEKDPTEWHTEQFFGNTVYVENDFPKIKYALDFVAIYTINGHKTLIIPGAYSVDKYYRIRNGWSWFNGEQLTKEEQAFGLKLLEKNSTFDFVLSHTCPISYEPTDLFLPTIDQSMVDKTMERYLGNIEYNIQYRAWLFGHYHQHREYPREAAPATYENPRILMLFQDVVELEDVLNNENYVNKL